MLRVSIKGVLARKLRLLLTSIAIVLGVGFVSGAYFLTDAMKSSFDDIFEQANSRIDVEVRTTKYVQLSKAQSQGVAVPIDMAKVGVSPEALETIRSVPGVRKAEGVVFELGAQPLGKDGTPITKAGPPAFAAGWDDEAGDMRVLRIAKGHAPGRGELLLDRTAYDKSGLKIGDHVDVLFQGGAHKERFTLVGVVTFGDRDNLNGASITVFDTPQLQELLHMGGRFTTVDAVAGPGVSQDELRDRIADSLGKDYNVSTAPELTQEQSDQADQSFIKYLRYVVLAFAFVAVFVGAFTIFNTFTIIVGQRTREFGLLRMLGARRRQVLGVVTLEALVVGIVASTIGILVGYGIAVLLRLALNAFGLDLPDDPFPIETRTIVVSYAVGVLVTLVSSFVPAWRASRLAPLEAIRSTTTSRDRGWKVPAAGAIAFAIGVVLIARGLMPDDDAGTKSILVSIGIGFLVAIIGLAMLSRLFIAPISRILGVVLARGATGRIALGNVLRNRSRAATTASALMIGMALASLVLVFYASLQATMDDQIQRSFGADISVYNSSFGGASPTVNDEIVDKIRKVEGVDTLARQYAGTAIVGRTFAVDDKPVQAITAFSKGGLGTHSGIVRVDLVDGSIDPGTGVLVSDDFAKEHHLKVGSTLHLSFPSEPTEALHVKGIFKASQVVGTSIVVSPDTFMRTQPEQVHAAAFVAINVDEGTKPSVVVKRINKALGRDSKFIEVLDSEGLKKMFRDQLAPIVGMVFALLSLSVLIALFGIGNTLALNVFERTREIGLLRAVGGTRRQLRRIVRVESVLVAMFGAIVGVLVGVGAGAALIRALHDEGFVLGVSFAAIVGVLVGGFLAGIVAGALPARRAARIDVLAAIANE